MSASDAERPLDVLVVGGGTVGHLAPGFAVAEVLRARGYRVAFATPRGGNEAAWFPEGEEAPLTCPALRLPRSKLGYPRFVGALLSAVHRARGLLGTLRPGAVLALGGWPCVPTALAARTRGMPLALVASDAKPGRAVLRLASSATRIYAAQESAGAALPAEKTLVCGPIVRASVLEGRRDPAAFGLDPDRLTLFVTGGSLGALALNRLVAEALVSCVEADPAFADRVQVLHSVGRSEAGVEALYRKAGLRYHVAPFVRAMGTAWHSADLALCRAGALTCAELEATGTPAVLVPYPHHADRQQYANAEPLERRGAAVLRDEGDLDASALGALLRDLLGAPEQRAAMADAMRARGAEGARHIADDLVRLLGEGARPSPERA